MALLGPVEARSLRGRLIHGTIFLLLLAGGITTVYPFVIMLSGSVRSEMDHADLDIIPDFWVNQSALYRKFLEVKYNQDVAALNAAHLEQNYSFRQVPDPEPDTDLARRLQQYIEQSDLPRHWQVLGGIRGVRTVPENLRALRDRLSERYRGNINAFARDVGIPIESWRTLTLAVPQWTTQRYQYSPSPLYDTYFELLDEAPPANRQLVSISGWFLETMIFPTYARQDTGLYNEAHVDPLTRYSTFRLPRRVPDERQPRLRAEWIEFVTQELNPSFVTVENVTPAQYREFVVADAGPDHDWPLPDGRTWLHGEERATYQRFLETRPATDYVLQGPEYDFGPDLPRAVTALELDYVDRHSGSLRYAYSVHNYVNVIEELALQGNALGNTVIICVLAIVGALLINPLAAYALSRFGMPGTYKILLFLMATMAFPPMVTLIPQFILLRKLELLNTFVALVLPLLVNGYMIFLLKGFFDSLPRELYEAARIDGCSEMRMFVQIAMALSKPILAVLALTTFTSAYTMFLYPLLVAPDPDMWLISVWLYQFQQRSDAAAVYAAVVLASIPTLVIFLVAQRTIMRGIVVPTEK